MPPGLVPIVQVAVIYDKWWCIPPGMSQELYEMGQVQAIRGIGAKVVDPELG